MPRFTFLHAADLHLDSPLRGLEAYEGAPVEEIRQATRQAFENLVTLAITERVALVIIAGDLFDRKWTDIQTGLWTAAQFRRLERESIPVYLVRGNHDALSEVPQRITWPANVHEFPVDRAGTFTIPELRVALHGRGFPAREVPEDLTTGYPPHFPEHLNIGVLHTSLSGDQQHDTYAPTTVETLKLAGYDYWALGHLHARSIVSEAPFIAFSGCTQGRHINEPGAKGCLLVSVDGDHIDARFQPLDVVRWGTVIVDAAGAADVAELLEIVESALLEFKDRCDGRLAATRIIVQGQSPLFLRLRQPHQVEEFVTRIRDRANAVDHVWIEKVVFSLVPPLDVQQLRERDDLLGELLRDLHSLQQDDPRELAEFSAVLEPLARKAGMELKEASVDLQDPENIRRWLHAAQDMLIASLAADQLENADERE